MKVSESALLHESILGTGVAGHGPLPATKVVAIRRAPASVVDMGDRRLRRRTSRRVAGWAAIVVVAASIIASSPAAVAGGTYASAELAALDVKGRAPMTGYSREAFGPEWSDVDRNGCDTRNDILQRDLVRTTVRNCVVYSGTLYDPYTRKVIAHQRGRYGVDIDHVVALGNAWQTGAFRWTADRRKQFANDPLNLLAVDASANRQKGDGDAATWLPANKAYRCAYVARQTAVKSKYGLWVTPAEKSAMVRVLATCPGQRTPDS
jgi:hypothetical protein